MQSRLDTTATRVANWLAARSTAMPCNGAADGLAKAIVEMQHVRDALNAIPGVLHREWLEVTDNHVTVRVNAECPAHIEHCEVTLGVGSYGDLVKE